VGHEQQRGSANRLSHIPVYIVLFLLHVSLFLKNYHQAVEEMRKERQFKRNPYFNYFFVYFLNWLIIASRKAETCR
jgi:hypothetical protein